MFLGLNSFPAFIFHSSRFEEVGGAVYRINNPCWVVSKFTSFPFRSCLFANESERGERMRHYSIHTSHIDRV